MNTHGMAEIAVSILHWVNDDQPGVVEFSLVDCDGRDWRFVDKLPMVTAEYLDGTSVYPQPGSIRCKILSFGHDATGREIALIDTHKPWYVETVDKKHVFRVFADQLDRNVPQNEERESVPVTIVVTATRR